VTAALAVPTAAVAQGGNPASAPVAKAGGGKFTPSLPADFPADAPLPLGTLTGSTANAPTLGGRAAHARRLPRGHGLGARLLVLGSRYLPGGGTDGWSRSRLAMSRVGCTASRLALGLPFSDLSGGFKLWRAECLAAIDMDELLSTGYAFQVETTQFAHLHGARIEEVPFVFSERIAGASKMTLRISLEGIRVTLALRRHHRPGRRAGGLMAL